MIFVRRNRCTSLKTKLSCLPTSPTGGTPNTGSGSTRKRFSRTYLTVQFTHAPREIEGTALPANIYTANGTDGVRQRTRGFLSVQQSGCGRREHDAVFVGAFYLRLLPPSPYYTLVAV